jgi:hypothetical protein
MTRWTLVVGLIVAAATASRASESVTIRVSPAIAFAPADLVIRTNIEPNGHNRGLAIVADSNSFYRSSSIQLDGDRAPKTTTVTFHSVPAGEYDITASVIGPDGHSTAQAHTAVMIVGSH